MLPRKARWQPSVRMWELSAALNEEMESWPKRIPAFPSKDESHYIHIRLTNGRQTVCASGQTGLIPRVRAGVSRAISSFLEDNMLALFPSSELRVFFPSCNLCSIFDRLQ